MKSDSFLFQRRLIRSKARHGFGGGSKPLGFSLIELLIVLAIFSVLLGAIMGSLGEGQNAASISRDENETQQNLQDALLLMSNEIRMAGFPPPSFYDKEYLQLPSTHKNLVAAGLVEIGPQVLKFQGDINGDGEVDYIHYYLTGASVPYTLNRFGGKLKDDGSLPGGSPQKLSEQVEDFGFRYFDRNGVETSLIQNVVQVEVRLTLRTRNVDPYSHVYRSANQAVRVRPPNL